MWVKLRTTLAGPHHSGQPGQVIEVSDIFGASLTTGGYAELARAPGSEVLPGAKAAPGPETTDDPQVGAERALEPGHEKVKKGRH
jgi:hypothetical protein